MQINSESVRTFIGWLLVAASGWLPMQTSAVTLLGGDGVIYRKVKAEYRKSIALVDDRGIEDISIAWATYNYDAKTIFGRLTPSRGLGLQAFSAAPSRKPSVSAYRNAHAVVVPADPLLQMVVIETNLLTPNASDIVVGSYEKFRYELISRNTLRPSPKSDWISSSDSLYVSACAASIHFQDNWANGAFLGDQDIKRFNLEAATGLTQKQLSFLTTPQCWADGTSLLYARIHNSQLRETKDYQIVRGGPKSAGVATTVVVNTSNRLTCFPLYNARRFAMCSEDYNSADTERLFIVDFEKNAVATVKGMEKYYRTSVILVGFSPDSSRAYFYKYKSPRNGLPQLITVNISESPVATIENLPDGLRVVSAFDE